MYSTGKDQLHTGKNIFDIGGGRSFYASSHPSLTAAATPEKVLGIFDHVAGYNPTGLSYHALLHSQANGGTAHYYSTVNDDGDVHLNFGISSNSGDAGMHLSSKTSENSSGGIMADDVLLHGRQSFILAAMQNYVYPPAGDFSMIDGSVDRLIFRVQGLTTGATHIEINKNDVTLGASNGSVLVDKDPTVGLGVASKQYVDAKFPANNPGSLTNDGNGNLSWTVPAGFDPTADQTITGVWSFVEPVVIDNHKIGGNVTSPAGTVASVVSSASAYGYSGLLPTPFDFNSNVVDGYVISSIYDETALSNSSDVESGVTVRDDDSEYIIYAKATAKKDSAGYITNSYTMDVTDSVNSLYATGSFSTNMLTNTSRISLRAMDASTTSSNIALDADGTARTIAISADTITMTGEVLVINAPTQNTGAVNKQYAHNLANYRALIVDFDTSSPSEIIIGEVPENSIIVNWTVHTEVYFNGASPATLSIGTAASNSGVASVGDIDLADASVDSLRTFYKVTTAVPGNLIIKGYFTKNDSTQGSGTILIEYYTPAI